MNKSLKDRFWEAQDVLDVGCLVRDMAALPIESEIGFIIERKGYSTIKIYFLDGNIQEHDWMSIRHKRSVLPEDLHKREEFEKKNPEYFNKLYDIYNRFFGKN